MAKYNLNEVLKAKALEENKKNQTETGKPLALDDVSRVKVLSPGAQVFKRFIRNRLAVFGTCVLILMFLFSFLGPVFYPYGQKDIFYTFSNEVGRITITAIQCFLILKRIMYLSIRHCTTVKPDVNQVGFAHHLATGR